VTFYGDITDPATSGGTPNDIFGFIDIDADQNANTGISSADLSAQRGFGSLPALGVDYYIDLGTGFSNPGFVNLIGANGTLTSAAITYSSDSLTVSVALSALGGSNNVNAGMIAVDPNMVNNLSLNNGQPFVSDTAAFIQGPAVVPAPGGLTLLGTGALFLGGFYLCSRRRVKVRGLRRTGQVRAGHDRPEPLGHRGHAPVYHLDQTGAGPDPLGSRGRRAPEL
jgi:hypothetical protein